MENSILVIADPAYCQNGRECGEYEDHNLLCTGKSGFEFYHRIAYTKEGYQGKEYEIVINAKGVRNKSVQVELQ